MAYPYVEEGYIEDSKYVVDDIVVFWDTKVVYIPKVSLTLVQSTPTEIWELDLNQFRLKLKSLEDDEEGMPYPDTHHHNTEVNVGGITLARVVEIINDYTITFEDGKYAVNLIGANSNVGDRVNVNQVSVRSQNSAGLTSSPLIEYGAFEGGVTYDEVNGVPGTAMPIGTPKMPVNNMTDAKIIAEYRGFNTGYIKGGITIDDTEDVSGFIFQGEGGDNRTIITVLENANTYNCVFRDASLTGALDGKATAERCAIGELRYINGYLYECAFIGGTIVLGSGSNAYMINCWSDNFGPGTPIVDMGGSGQALAVQNFNGELTIINKNGPEFLMITLNAGYVYIDLNTVTNGVIVASGVGRLLNLDTGNDLVTGDYGTLTVQNSTLSTESVWNYQGP